MSHRLVNRQSARCVLLRPGCTRCRNQSSCGQRGREKEIITHIRLRVGPKGVRRVKDLWPHWCTSTTVNQCARVCRNATSCTVNPSPQNRTEETLQRQRVECAALLFAERASLITGFSKCHKKERCLCKDSTRTESATWRSSTNAQTQTCLKDGRRPAVTADWISFLRTPLIPLWIFSY